jgi:hypothetical protein
MKVNIKSKKIKKREGKRKIFKRYNPEFKNDEESSNDLELVVDEEIID